MSSYALVDKVELLERGRHHRRRVGPAVNVLGVQDRDERSHPSLEGVRFRRVRGWGPRGVGAYGEVKRLDLVVKVLEDVLRFGLGLGFRVRVRFGLGLIKS